MMTFFDNLFKVFAYIAIYIVMFLVCALILLFLAGLVKLISWLAGFSFWLAMLVSAAIYAIILMVYLVAHNEIDLLGENENPFFEEE